MADDEKSQPDEGGTPPTQRPPTPPDEPTAVRPPDGPPIEDITMFRPPEPTPPPAASPPPAAPTAPPPPTGGAPYQPPAAPYQPPAAPYQPAAPGQGYQPYGAPPPVAGGYPVPGAKIPGQIDPESGLPYSDKERLTAGLLQLVPSLMGIPGIGRLYTGHMAIGLIQLIGTVSGWVFTCILVGLLWAIPLWIWGVIDGILMLTNKRFTDADGRVLR